MTALRTCVVLVAVLIGLSTPHMIAPEWSRRNGLDMWSLGAELRAHRKVTEEGAEMTATVERFVQRTAVAQQIAVRLSANTITLPAAADELMMVFEDDASMRYTLEMQYSRAPTVRHAFALHAIERVRWLLANDPNRAEVLARLEVEYRAMCTAPALPMRCAERPGFQNGP